MSSRKPKLLPTVFPAESPSSSSRETAESVIQPDSGWGPLLLLGEAEARELRYAGAKWRQGQARELAAETWDETGHSVTLH